MALFGGKKEKTFGEEVMDARRKIANAAKANYFTSEGPDSQLRVANREVEPRYVRFDGVTLGMDKAGAIETGFAGSDRPLTNASGDQYTPGQTAGKTVLQNLTELLEALDENRDNVAPDQLRITLEQAGALGSEALRSYTDVNSDFGSDRWKKLSIEALDATKREVENELNEGYTGEIPW